MDHSRYHSDKAYRHLLSEPKMLRELLESFVPLENLDKEIIVCADCGRQAIRLVGNARGGAASDYERKRFPYFDESLNKNFSSNAEKKKYLKEKGFVQIDGAHGIKKERRRSYFTST